MPDDRLHGRVGLYEILVMSPELRKLVKPQADIARLRDQATAKACGPLRISGAMKVAAGVTSLGNRQVAPPADED